MARPDVVTVQIKRVGGQKVIDIRRAISVPGGYIPTSRGVSLPIERLEELIEKLENANGEVEVIEL